MMRLALLLVVALTLACANPSSQIATRIEAVDALPILPRSYAVEALPVERQIGRLRRIVPLVVAVDSEDTPTPESQEAHQMLVERFLADILGYQIVALPEGTLDRAASRST